MVWFHGTTDRSARRIAAEGFMPKKPSRRVWFAAGRGYALGRAKTKARRAHARPVVLVCELDLAALRRKLGTKKIRCRNGILAIDGPVPADVVRGGGEPMDHPATPKELAEWINSVLGLKPHKGVGRRHAGIVRLSKWVTNRTQSEPRRGIRRTELIEMARQWLGEFFDGVEIDPNSLRVYRPVRPADVHVEPEPPEVDPREAEALELIEDQRPKRRVRGLGLLAEMSDPDLFEWCAMYLDDEDVRVRAAALRAMLRCDGIDAELIEPLADSPEKRIRGAAIAALARHAAAAAPKWFERGLKDPSACVRLETAAQLEHLDATDHHRLFDLARYDPNPKVARLGQKLTAGRGYPELSYRRPRG